MGWWRNLFRARSRADDDLFAALLKFQSDRLQADTEVAKLDRELTLRTKHLELENLERISEERRKDAVAKAELRDKRREWARQAREKVGKSKQAPGEGRSFRSGVQGCVVCADSTSPRLTAEEITWHNAGHPGAMTQ